MTFLMADTVHMAANDSGAVAVMMSDARLRTRAERMRNQIKARSQHFRRPVMSDGAMAIMLSLFQNEFEALSLTRDTLAMANMLEDGEATRIIENLVNAGLIAVTGENPERRTVGLSPLGSAHMRSFVSDFPEF